MEDEIYEQLADALNRLPNGFPRTPSNVEILLLKKIFSREEAALAGRLSREKEPVQQIAKRIGRAAEDVQSQLMGMAKKGLVWFSKKEGKAHFRLAPFMVGIYEAHLENIDHEFAHLFEEYMADGGAAGIMKPQPALHRVIPTQGAVKSEWILPYDDVRAILEAATSFRVRDCICRVQQDYLGQRRCNFPIKNCVTFSSIERPPRPDDISREEALRILDEAEEIGLVHTVSNVVKGIFYVCNCCGCCCCILRGITEWGIEKSVACASYCASIDANTCDGCGICIERCQVHALYEENGIAVVDPEKCIGCGLCVTGCPIAAATLNKRPDAEIVPPPIDFATWEKNRLSNRDLAR